MPLDIPRIQAIFFDVDGTLSDTDDQMVAQVARMLRPLRVLFHRKDIRTFARRLIMGIESPGNYLYSLPDQLGIDKTLDRVYEWGSRRHARQKTHFWLIPRVKGMLEKLHHQYPLGVISIRRDAVIQDFLDQFDLQPIFKTRASAYTCEHTKPFPDPVLWSAGQLGVDPRNCLMVGDTTVDIRAGRAAGTQTAGVLCGFGEEKELRRAGADLILPSTAELAQVLLEGKIDSMGGAS